VELDKLFMDVAVYNNCIMGPEHVEPSVDLACRTALAYHGVAHITIPSETQEKELSRKSRSKRNRPHHTSEA
jgi:pyruvate dehydrogenase (quinone)